MTITKPQNQTATLYALTEQDGEEPITALRKLEPTGLFEDNAPNIPIYHAVFLVPFGKRQEIFFPSFVPAYTQPDATRDQYVFTPTDEGVEVDCYVIPLCRDGSVNDSFSKCYFQNHPELFENEDDHEAFVEDHFCTGIINDMPCWLFPADDVRSVKGIASDDYFVDEVAAVSSLDELEQYGEEDYSKVFQDKDGREWWFYAWFHQD